MSCSSELVALVTPDVKATLDGPIGVATVRTSSLAQHEFATHALKYGALAVPE